jgi:hypothetical protein
MVANSRIHDILICGGRGYIQYGGKCPRKVGNMENDRKNSLATNVRIGGKLVPLLASIPDDPCEPYTVARLVERIQVGTDEIKSVEPKTVVCDRQGRYVADIDRSKGAPSKGVSVAPIDASAVADSSIPIDAYVILRKLFKGTDNTPKILRAADRADGIAYVARKLDLASKGTIATGVDYTRDTSEDLAKLVRQYFSEWFAGQRIGSVSPCNVWTTDNVVRSVGVSRTRHYDDRPAYETLYALLGDRLAPIAYVVVRSRLRRADIKDPGIRDDAFGEVVAYIIAQIQGDKLDLSKDVPEGERIAALIVTCRSGYGMYTRRQIRERRPVAPFARETANGLRLLANEAYTRKGTTVYPEQGESDRSLDRTLTMWEIMSNMTNRDYKVMRLIGEGYSQSQVADMVGGLSQRDVSRILAGARLAMRNALAA